MCAVRHIVLEHRRGGWVARSCVLVASAQAPRCPAPPVPSPLLPLSKLAAGPLEGAAGPQGAAAGSAPCAAVAVTTKV